MDLELLVEDLDRVARQVGGEQLRLPSLDEITASAFARDFVVDEAELALGGGRGGGRAGAGRGVSAELAPVGVVSMGGPHRYPRQTFRTSALGVDSVVDDSRIQARARSARRQWNDQEPAVISS